MSLFLIIVEEQPYIFKYKNLWIILQNIFCCDLQMKVFQVWNDMKVSTLFFIFNVNYPFQCPNTFCRPSK